MAFATKSRYFPHLLKDAKNKAFVIPTRTFIYPDLHVERPNIQSRAQTPSTPSSSPSSSPSTQPTTPPPTSLGCRDSVNNSESPNKNPSNPEEISGDTEDIHSPLISKTTSTSEAQSGKFTLPELCGKEDALWNRPAAVYHESIINKPPALCIPLTNILENNTYDNPWADFDFIKLYHDVLPPNRAKVDQHSGARAGWGYDPQSTVIYPLPMYLRFLQTTLPLLQHIAYGCSHCQSIWPFSEKYTEHRGQSLNPSLEGSQIPPVNRYPLRGLEVPYMGKFDPFSLEL